MNAPDHLFVFRLDEQRLALPLEAVERVIRAVEITPLPKAPPGILGVINLQGHMIPVLNLHKLLGLEPHSAPPRELELSDQLIIAHLSGRRAALAVDEVKGVVAGAAQQLTHSEDGEAAGHGLRHIMGALTFEDGIAAICDPDRLLAAAQSELLDQAMPPQEGLA